MQVQFVNMKAAAGLVAPVITAAVRGPATGIKMDDILPEVAVVHLMLNRIYVQKSFILRAITMVLDILQSQHL